MDYRPHKGFFDLSQKPDTLSDKEYQTIIKTQDYLATENEKMKDKKVRSANMNHWNELKALSAKLQEIILAHWNLLEI